MKVSKLFYKINLSFPYLFIIFSSAFIIFSIYNLSNKILPTLSTMVFSTSLFSLLGSIFYIYKRKITFYVKTEVTKNKTFLILKIIYIISTICILLIADSSSFVKPTPYYFLVSICTVTIGLQIGLKEVFYKRDILEILFLQIIPLGLIVRGASLFISPFHVGLDTGHFHYPQISQIIQNGYLNHSAFHYFYYPSSHLIQAISGLIIGFSVNLFKTVNLFNSIVLLMVSYLIGSKLYTEREGLMFALLVSIATMPLFLTIYSTSKIGGATLLFLDMYFLLKMLDVKIIKDILMFFICTISLFLWHPEISGVLLFIIFAYSITLLLVRKNSKVECLCLLYTVAFIAYYAYVATYLFNHIVSCLFFENVTRTPGLIQSFEGKITLRFLSQLFTGYLGITFPFFFVSFSIISWLRKPTQKNIFLILCLFAIFMIPIVGVTTGNFGLNPERLLTYISILSLIFFSCTLFNIFDVKSKKNILLIIAILFIYSFFSTSSYIVADGNEVYNDEIPVDIIYTTYPNMAANKFINENTPQGSIIFSDPSTLYTSYLHKQQSFISNITSNGYIWENFYNQKREKLEIRDNTTTKNNKVYDNRYNAIEQKD
jgi:hypothetical protein